MRRYSRIKQRRKPKGKYYINTILPDIPLSQNDTYIITQDGDRLDNLSFEFYKDTQFWWVIAAANPNKLRKDSYYVPLGEQIRIPSDPFTYVDNFTDFNNNNR